MQRFCIPCIINLFQCFFALCFQITIIGILHLNNNPDLRISYLDHDITKSISRFSV